MNDYLRQRKSRRVAMVLALLTLFGVVATLVSGAVTASAAFPVFTIVKDNDANHDGVYSDTEYVAKDATYPYTVTYKVTLATQVGATVVSLSDDKTANLDSASASPSCSTIVGMTIAPGSSQVCYYDVTLTQAGTSPLVNTATVVWGNGDDHASDASTVNFPSLSLTKSSTTTLVTVPGQVVPYSYVITDTGTAALTGITLADDKTDSPPVCPGTTLALGASMTCTGQHTVTQAEFTAGGNLVNTATASSNEAPDATATLSIPIQAACPASPPKVNVRWHYSANGSSGSWSGTGGATCGQTITLGPQAMEGNLQVNPGATIKAGYDFTLPGNNHPFTVSFTNGKVVFQVRCVSGAAPSQPTFTITLPNQSYSAPDSNWYPSGQQNNPLVYQGSITAPDLCAGGALRLDKGGTFSAFLTIN